MSMEIGSACGTRGVVWTDGRCIPQSVMNPDPQAVWGFDVLIPIVSAVLLAIIIYRCIREKCLTWSFLVATASATTWWLETFGDWGQHLLYSPKLNHYTLDWWYTAPHNPVLMPVTYALYWWAHAWAILRVVQYFRKNMLTTISMGLGIILLSVPFTWLWNIVVEGPATYFGLWTYDPPIGPGIEWPRGSYWPILWPSMLMVGWINLIAWMVGLPEESNHLNKLERFFHLQKLLQRAGWSKSASGSDAGAVNPVSGNWKFQSIRWLCWVAFFNVTFLLTLVLPLFLMRMVFAFHSEYLPIPW